MRVHCPCEGEACTGLEPATPRLPLRIRRPRDSSKFLVRNSGEAKGPMAAARARGVRTPAQTVHVTARPRPPRPAPPRGEPLPRTGRVKLFAADNELGLSQCCFGCTELWLWDFHRPSESSQPPPGSAPQCTPQMIHFNPSTPASPFLITQEHRDGKSWGPC